MMEYNLSINKNVYYGNSIFQATLCSNSLAIITVVSFHNALIFSGIL